MSFRPLSNKILIRPEAKKDKTEGGIFIPETATNDAPRIGTVVAVGRGNVLINEKGDGYVVVPLEVKAGDTVMYPPMDFVEIEYNKETCLLMTEEQVLGII